MPATTKYYLSNLTREDKKFLLMFSFSNVKDLLKLDPLKKNLLTKIIKLENHQPIDMDELEKEATRIQTNLHFWQDNFTRLLTIIDKLKNVKEYNTEVLPILRGKQIDAKIELFLEGLTIDIAQGIAKYLDRNQAIEKPRINSIKKYSTIHNFLYVIIAGLNILRNNLNSLPHTDKKFRTTLNKIQEYIRTIDQFKVGLFELNKQFEDLKHSFDTDIYSSIFELPQLLKEFNPQLEFALNKLSNANPNKNDIQELLSQLEILLVLIKRFILL